MLKSEGVYKRKDRERDIKKGAYSIGKDPL